MMQRLLHLRVPVTWQWPLTFASTSLPVAREIATFTLGFQALPFQDKPA